MNGEEFQHALARWDGRLGDLRVSMCGPGRCGPCQSDSGICLAVVDQRGELDRVKAAIYKGILPLPESRAMAVQRRLRDLAHRRRTRDAALRNIALSMLPFRWVEKLFAPRGQWWYHFGTY